MFNRLRCGSGLIQETVPRFGFGPGQENLFVHKFTFSTYKELIFFSSKILNLNKSSCIYELVEFDHLKDKIYLSWYTNLTKLT